MRWEVPELVRQRAMANGDAGRRWLDELPATIEHLAAAWDLTLGAPFARGTAGFVVATEDAAGTACVLKIAMPIDMDEIAGFRRAVTVHQLAAGRGCARLLAHDSTVPAMLLERLGPDLHQLGYATPQVLEVIADTLRTFWRPVPPDCGLPTGPEKAAWLVEFVTTTWRQLDRPCPRTVIERAVDYCHERAAAFDPSTAVMVHGDAHGWNTLRAPGGGYAFVDPEGIISEPAHDLAVPMREYNQPLLAGDTDRLVRDRAEMLAARCEVDPEAILQWGFVERVSTGLANLRDFDDGAGRMFLAVAERCR
jgi:streptomycin 6-kinase